MTFLEFIVFYILFIKPALSALTLIMLLRHRESFA